MWGVDVEEWVVVVGFVLDVQHIKNKAHYNLMRGQAICGAAKCRQSAQHSPNAMWTERTRESHKGKGGPQINKQNCCPQGLTERILYTVYGT